MNVPHNDRAAGRGALNGRARHKPRRIEKSHPRARVRQYNVVDFAPNIWYIGKMGCDHQHPTISNIEQLQFENVELNIARYSDAHGFLRAVYNNEALPLQVRLDAARTAIKYERPTLAAVAVQHSDDDIADQLAAGRRRADRLASQDGAARLLVQHTVER